jgi:hypothetical protein
VREGGLLPPAECFDSRFLEWRKSIAEKGNVRILAGGASTLVRKGGLEPPWVSPPDPKSGASANSATFAGPKANKDCNPEEPL